MTQLLLHRSSSFVLSQYMKRRSTFSIQSSALVSLSRCLSSSQQQTTAGAGAGAGSAAVVAVAGTTKKNINLNININPTPRNLSSLPIDYTNQHQQHHHHHHPIEERFNSSNDSPSHLSYVADVTYPITSKLNIVKPEDDTPSGIWPVYRIMDEDGNFRNSYYDGYHDHHNNDHEIASSTYYPQQSYNNMNDSSSSLSSTPTATSDINDQNNNIHELKTKILNQYPEHTKALQSSPIFHTTTHNNNSPNTLKSYANTYSSLTQHTSSTLKNKNSILLRTHRIMTRLRQMDDILLNAQRQGRVSFYLTCRGEEGIHIGSASALSMEDVVLAQYREQGIFMWRGFTLEQFTNQCMTNDLDLGRGRQMPIHYGSRALNIHTISSPLGTQLPQAVGVAYKKKLNKLSLKETIKDSSSSSSSSSSISIVYFGDGAASTTDFHSALNFASTLKVPMIFFCRNNGYAISTKITEQYASDGIVSRCKAYGMAGIRVDGNDVFAVHAATKAAREYAIEHSEPVLIEAISYRQGHHSTSDDSSQYRSSEEVSECECVHDPLNRFEKFLLKHEWIDEESIASIEKEERKAVMEALQQAEKRKGPGIGTMFQDVYSEMPLNLVMQEKSLHKHMKKYPSKYHH